MVFQWTSERPSRSRMRMADGTVGTRPYRHALNPRRGTTTAASAIRRDRRATSNRPIEEPNVASDGSGDASAESTARARAEMSLLVPRTAADHGPAELGFTTQASRLHRPETLGRRRHVTAAVPGHDGTFAVIDPPTARTLPAAPDVAAGGGAPSTRARRCGSRPFPRAEACASPSTTA